MNRIILTLAFVLFFASLGFSAEVQDLTPATTPTPDTGLPPYYTVNNQLEEARILSAISRVESRVAAMETTLAKVPSSEILTKVKEEIHADVAIQLKEHTTNIIITLIVFMLFEGALLFLAKAKGWL